MHREYGPVVRIMPDVLHVHDPSFIDKLYSQSPKQRHERAYTVLNFFHTHKSVLPTGDHELHRRRRAVLSPFFSRQNVRRLVPVINETLSNLLDRMEGWGKSESPICMNGVYKAASKDVIQSYALGEGKKCLEMEDCNANFFEVLSPRRGCHFTRHFHALSVLLTKLPVSVITSLDPSIRAFIQFVEVSVSLTLMKWHMILTYWLLGPHRAD